MTDDSNATPFRWLLALDPGLDVTGLALYRLEPQVDCPRDPQTALDRLKPLLMDVASLHTASDMTTARRLLDLQQKLWEYMRRATQVYPQLVDRPGIVIIEEPANFFNYARGGAGGPSMVKGLYLMGLASAALALTLSALHPQYVKADTTKREHKQRFAHDLWQAAGCPKGLRRPVHAIGDDARSAIWLGAHYLIGRPPTRVPHQKKPRKPRQKKPALYEAEPEALPSLLAVEGTIGGRIRE